MGERPARAGVPVVWLGIAAVAAVKVLVSLAFANRYGWFRDELYYRASGLHLSFGYVDYPPMVAVVARLAQVVAPDSLVALRGASILAGAGVVLLAGVMARELGGGWAAQVGAAASVALCPLFIGGNFLFGTVALDQLVWSALLLVVVRILGGGDRRLWLLAGGLLGVGLETKYTIAALVVALTLGLLLTRSRRHLATPWPWLGFSIAVLLWLPNLAWQFTHGWISVAYVLFHSGNTGSRLDYVVEQLTLVNPALVPLLVLGAIGLWRSPAHRALFWTAVLVEVLFFLALGKFYYPGAIYPLLFASGAVFVERVARSRLLRASWIGAALAVTLLLTPFVLPVLPAATFARSPSLVAADPLLAEMYGWPGFGRQMAAAYESVPARERGRTLVLCQNYGEAGAVALYQPGLPVVSPHLTFYYWAPPRMDPRTVVAVGYTRGQLHQWFASVKQVGTVHEPYGIRDQEAGNPIFICTAPRAPLWTFWPSMQELD